MQPNTGWHRVLMLGFLLAPLASCAHADREVVEATHIPSEYLECPRQGAVPAAERFLVGRGGGRLRHGPHELTIPALALLRQDTITIREVPGDSVGVRIEAPQFARTVHLTVSFARCGRDLNDTWAVYRHREHATPDRLKTRITNRDSVAVTKFRRHSGFIIARDRP